MEHRHDRRFNVSDYITIHKSDGGFRSTYVINMSYGGAFIITPELDLRRGDIVYCDGNKQHSANTQKYALRAMVIHSDADGIGLAWLDSDTHIYQALARIMVSVA